MIRRYLLKIICLFIFSRRKRRSFRDKYSKKQKPPFEKIHKNMFLSLLKRKLFQQICRNKINKNKRAKILVHLHLYYTSFWDDICEYLKNLECYNYDLFITHSQEYPEELIRKIKKFKPNVSIIKTENRGFDLGPFIKILNKISLKKYDLIFKIHTKRDVTKNLYYGLCMKGNEWRKFLYDAILGAKNVHKAIDVALNSKKYGIVCHKKLITKYDIISNKSETLKLMRHYKLNIPEEYEFIIGTMFLAKAEVFNNIRKKVKITDFDYAERGVFTKAHMFERILSLNATAQGYLTYGTNPFFYKSFIRKIQSKKMLRKTKKFDPDFFIDLELIKPISLYEKKIRGKRYTVSSKLRTTNKQLWEYFKTKINLKEDEIKKNTVRYLALVTDFTKNRKVAEIKSILETTIFKKIGNDITVEKKAKKTNKRLPWIFKSSSPKFIKSGTYLNDILFKDILKKDFVKIVKALNPYIKEVFLKHEIPNSNLLQPNSWDAIPRNVLIVNKNKFVFFDTNIEYLYGVDKAYFLFRVAYHLTTDKIKNQLTQEESKELFLLLCKKHNVSGDFKKLFKLEFKSQKLIQNRKLSLHKKIIRKIKILYMLLIFRKKLTKHNN